MGTIADKMEHLLTTKKAIKMAIEGKGVTVPTNTPFREYATLITTIKNTGTGIEGDTNGDGVVDENDKVASDSLKDVPEKYGDKLKTAIELYGAEPNDILISEDSEYISIGFLDEDFIVNSYNMNTTEFSATNWWFVSYNKSTGQWGSTHNWTDESSGYTYGKNIRYCTRSIVYGGATAEIFAKYENDFNRAKLRVEYPNWTDYLISENNAYITFAFLYSDTTVNSYNAESTAFSMSKWYAIIKDKNTGEFMNISYMDEPSEIDGSYGKNIKYGTKTVTYEYSTIYNPNGVVIYSKNGSSVSLPNLTNPATSANIMKGYEAIDRNGNVIIGTLIVKNDIKDIPILDYRNIVQEIIAAYNPPGSQLVISEDDDYVYVAFTDDYQISWYNSNDQMYVSYDYELYSYNKNTKEIIYRGFSSASDLNSGHLYAIVYSTQDLTFCGEVIFAKNADASSFMLPVFKESKNIGYGSASDCVCITYGNGVFVVSGYYRLVSFGGHIYPQIFTSKDGITWDGKYEPYSYTDEYNMIIAVQFGNGIFVWVNYKGQIAYSRDGVTWSDIVSVTNGEIPRVMTYGNGKFVILTSNTSWYSATADNWNYSSLPCTQTWKSITYGNGKFVALGNSAVSSKVIYSEDGITWYESLLPEEASWTLVTYAFNKFIAIEAHCTTAYSDDGINWLKGSGTLPNNDGVWCDAVYGDGFLIVVNGGSNKIAAYTEDGITWGSIHMPLAKLRSITYGGNNFVSVSKLTPRGVYSLEPYVYSPPTYYNSIVKKIIGIYKPTFENIIVTENSEYVYVAFTTNYTVSSYNAADRSYVAYGYDLYSYEKDTKEIVSLGSITEENASSGYISNIKKSTQDIVFNDMVLVAKNEDISSFTT